MAPRIGHSLLLIALAFTPGCGGSTGDSGSRQTAAQAAETARQEFDQRNYAAAAEHFTQAIDAGGLNSDLYVDAVLRRAVCYGAEGKFDEALADLSKIEQGAPNLDQLLAARAFVLKKMGKTVEANAAMAKARQINRTIKEF